MTLVVVLALGFALAYANGANDVSKGIATLVGSGVANYRRAVLWGTLWTGAGAIAAAFLARAMIETFGSGLLAKGIQPSFSAALATVAGAALWVAFATIKRLPVSTTHGIVGSVAGVASVAYGAGGVDWLSLAKKVALPLLLSPVVALVLTAVLLHLWRGVAWGTVEDGVGVEVIQTVPASNGVAAMASSTALVPQLHKTIPKAGEDREPRITLNHLHWLSSGATSFARGLNDAPKMAAILMSAALLSGAAALSPLIYFLAIALGILLGSWVAGRRVTELLACDVTRMDQREGFVANLVTATLVGAGAVLGWPMSTTQVASGAIFGIGSTGDEKVNRKTVQSMLVAWVVTLPGAALLGGAAFLLLHMIGMH